MESIPEAEYFMKDGCAMLKQALRVKDMLLRTTGVDLDPNTDAPFIFW